MAAALTTTTTTAAAADEPRTSPPPPPPRAPASPPSMKTSVALLAALLVLAAFCPAEAAPTATDTSPCCLKHSPQKIPKRLVKSFFFTSGKCSLPSVVFVFKSNKSACADPQATWVQDLLAALEQE